MTATAETELAVPGFRHEAFLYRGDDDFLRGAARFVTDGVAAGEPVLVAVAEPRWRRLLERVGAVEGVQHIDMVELGRNPGRIIPAWREFLADAPAAAPVRGIGEPVWAGRTPAEVREAQRHEVLLNAAFAGTDRDFWLLCPYDTAGLPEEHVHEARRSHAWVVREGRHQPSRTYEPWHDAGLDRLEDPLSEPPLSCDHVVFSAGDLAGLRALVSRRAGIAHLPRERTEVLVLAINELTTNSLQHGGGCGALLLWQQPGELVAEVRDSGHISDPLAGRERPLAAQRGGRGLWMVHQLCDLVEVRSRPGATSVRIHFSI